MKNYIRQTVCLSLLLIICLLKTISPNYVYKNCLSPRSIVEKQQKIFEVKQETVLISYAEMLKLLLKKGVSLSTVRETLSLRKKTGKLTSWASIVQFLEAGYQRQLKLKEKELNENLKNAEVKRYEEKKVYVVVGKERVEVREDEPSGASYDGDYYFNKRTETRDVYDWVTRKIEIGIDGQATAEKQKQLRVDYESEIRGFKKQWQGLMNKAKRRINRPVTLESIMKFIVEAKESFSDIMMGFVLDSLLKNILENFYGQTLNPEFIQNISLILRHREEKQRLEALIIAQKSFRYFMAHDRDNSNFQIYALLYEDGILGLRVKTRWLDEDDKEIDRSPLRGKDLFSLMIDHFGKKVKGIRGEWADQDNLRTFNELIEKGYTKEQAALGTWTGKQAVKYGYKFVVFEFERRSPARPNYYTYAKVVFYKNKPENYLKFFRLLFKRAA